jgi:transposase
MLFFGIDWSEDHHNLCILNEAGARISEIEFKHSVAGFAQIEAERRKLGVPASECLVAIETAYNLVVDFLLDYGYVVYIIPPQATEGYRNRHRSSGAHTDASDAALLAGALITDRQHHRLWRPNKPLTQEMAAQVRLVETVRRSIQRQSNQLRAALLRIHPGAIGLFGELTAQISLRFLMTYPTAEEAQALSQEAFVAFCHDQGYKRTDSIRFEQHFNNRIIGIKGLPRRCAASGHHAIAG